MTFFEAIDPSLKKLRQPHNRRQERFIRNVLQDMERQGISEISVLCEKLSAMYNRILSMRTMVYPRYSLLSQRVPFR